LVLMGCAAAALQPCAKEGWRCAKLFVPRPCVTLRWGTDEDRPRKLAFKLSCNWSLDLKLHLRYPCVDKYPFGCTCGDWDFISFFALYMCVKLGGKDRHCHHVTNL
jgi:hypothetical protein